MQPVVKEKGARKTVNVRKYEIKTPVRRVGVEETSQRRSERQESRKWVKGLTRVKPQDPASNRQAFQEEKRAAEEDVGMQQGSRCLRLEDPCPQVEGLPSAQHGRGKGPPKASCDTPRS